MNSQWVKLYRVEHYPGRILFIAAPTMQDALKIVPLNIKSIAEFGDVHVNLEAIRG